MLQNIFKQTCKNRYFELGAAKAIQSKYIKIPTYLSLGTEHIPPSVYPVCKDWLVFPQHRCHSYFLTFGGRPENLAKELLGRPDGCNWGMGGSASVSIYPNFFGHSGLLGDQIPIAVGAADASQHNTLVIAGDAAVEEDYALASLGYAVTRKVPILFLVEDNDLSILTKKSVRRSWDIVQVAKGFGMTALSISDDPSEILKNVRTLSDQLPALLNINTVRHLWHAGAGNDGPPLYNRFEIFKENMKSLGGEEIELEAKKEMEEVWSKLINGHQNKN